MSSEEVPEDLVDEEQPESVNDEVEPVRRQSSPTPFDHPLAFPLLLLAMGLWFGYDGWFNPKIKAVMFNKVMFVIFALGFVITMWISVREMRQSREQKSA